MILEEYKDESFPLSSFFLILLKYSWFTMLCLISAGQQSDSVIYIHEWVKVAQSYPALCDPMDYTVQWNSPGQNTGSG